MGHISIRLDRGDIQQLARDLDAVGELEAKALPALQAGAAIMLPAAIDATPVRSGRLQGTVKQKKRGSGARASIEVGPMGSGVSHLVEEGHGGPKPAPEHPFLKPAADSVEDQVLDAIANVLLEGI